MRRENRDIAVEILVGQTEAVVRIARITVWEREVAANVIEKCANLSVDF